MDVEEGKMKLGETIRIFRIANDYSTKQVAECCGISSTYVSEVESTHKNPSLETLKSFASCFKVPASTLMKICEKSEEENWTFQKTLLETLKIYVS